MVPGADQIIACPRCQGLAKYQTLMSGNTFGARIWTDGKLVAPMMPQPPSVVKCSHCDEVYWLTKAIKIGTMEWWTHKAQPIDPAWAAAQKVEEPSEQEYYQALENGLAKGSLQERNLRILAWWRRNDPFRDAPGEHVASIVNVTDFCKANLELLLRRLTKPNQGDCIIRAEVFRELGEFESANQALNCVTSVEYAPTVQQLRELCENRDTCVRELHSSG